MRAVRILQDHRAELNRLAEALLEHETLNKEEIISVCRGDKLIRSSLAEPEKPTSEKEEDEPADHHDKQNVKVMKTRGFTIFFNK